MKKFSARTFQDLRLLLVFVCFFQNWIFKVDGETHAIVIDVSNNEINEYLVTDESVPFVFLRTITVSTFFNPVDILYLNDMY
jgi:hypothetical protein